jgi:hypothetical protein
VLFVDRDWKWARLEEERPQDSHRVRMRYTDGGVPHTVLKSRARWFGLPKPTRSAICFTLSVVVFKR